MKTYITANGTGKLFVHSVWNGSWFIAVKFASTGRIIPFSPYMHVRFKTYQDAEDTLNEYAEVHNLQVIRND